MKKRIIALIVAAVMIFSLTSCIRIDTGMKFNTDGTVDITYLYAVSEEMLEESGEDMSSLTPDEETLAFYEESGVEYSEYNEDGYIGYTTKQTVSSSEIASGWIISGGKLYYDDYTDSITSESEDADGTTDLELISSLGGYITMTIELPVKPLASNATSVSEDGKRLTWDCLTADKLHIEYDVAEIEASGAKLPGCSVNPFVDVEYGTYYHDAVVWAYNNLITTGTTATKFAPEAICTRGQVVTFLWRSLGEPEPETTENPFTDVKESDYFYKAVLWAVENGVTTGTSATKFSPETTCSYAHILTFIWRTFGEPGKTGEGEWYTDAMNWALESPVAAEILTEESDPAAPCPRADVVTFLCNAYTNLVIFDIDEDYDEFEDFDFDFEI